MPEELGTVLDAAPEVSAEVEVEQPNEVQPEEGAEPVEIQQEATPEPKGDERVLPQWIRNLKTTDPAAFKEAKGQFFGKRTLDEKLKDFDLEGVKGFLEQYGGQEGLNEKLTDLQGKAEGFDGVLSKLEAGDASLISDMAQTSPEGFAKIAPAVIEQYRQTDPEGWAADMSAVMAATIQQNGIPMFLEKMDMMLEFGKADDARTMLQQLKGWASGFSQAAQAPRQQVAQPKGVDKLAEREQAIAQREQQIFTDDIKKSADEFRMPSITKELESFFSRRPKDSDAKELAIQTVKSQVVERMKADKDYQNKLTAFTSRGDKDGALKLLKSREAAAISEIAPKVGRMIFGNPGAAKQEDKKPEVGQKANPEAGFTLVDKAPAPQLIDRYRTTDAMIMRGKFILKDGRKLELQG